MRLLATLRASTQEGGKEVGKQGGKQGGKEGGRPGSAAAAAAIVDTRPPSEYAAAHLAGACSLPLSELRDRMGELPPATAGGVWLVAREDEMRASLAVLRGAAPAPSSDDTKGEGPPPAAMPTSARAAKTAGWNVLGRLSASPLLWAAAEGAGMLLELG